MGGRIDVGVDADGDTGLDSAADGEGVDECEFRFGFAIENKNSRGERFFDLCSGFADARKYDRRGVAGGSFYAVKLATRDNIESAAESSKNPENRKIGIGFYGITG